MTTFNVWAPLAERVELDAAGERHVMTRNEQGWWSARVQRSNGGGIDYAFHIDGGKALPDPRSPWQPEGVHGPSRTVDHAAFDWHDGRWQSPPLASAILYELHVGTFSPEGTFDGVVGKLDRLVDLGVTHIELMPVAQFAGSRGWGYDGVNLFAPHSAYGGPDGLKRLVDACHAKGLGVVLDVVYNHLGPEGNYLHQFGPYFTDRYKTPWGQAVNFDGPHSDPVRRFVCNNALMWLRDYHIDGLRLDGVHAIVDTSAVHITEQLADETAELAARIGRQLFLIAESDLNNPRLIRSAEAGGFGLDAQWCDDFHHAVHSLVSGERDGYYADFGRVADLAKSFRGGYVYDGRYSQVRHRRHGRPAIGLSGRRFVVFAQNHDQIGNRAQGRRLSQLVEADKLRLAAGLVLCSPFVPMLFQGEEWAAGSPFQYFTDLQDPTLGEAVAQGRQREFVDFGWDPDQVPNPQDEQTFARSRLDWSEPDQPAGRAMLDWHRRLIRLRREIPDLCDGRLDRVQTRFDEDAGWLLVERGQATLLANFSPRTQRVAIAPGRPTRLRAASQEGVEINDSQATLPPWAFAVLAE